MNETTIDTIERHARVAFMAAVTTAMLALTYHHATRGLSGLPNIVVYALTAACGLEFIGASWSSRWRVASRGERSLH
jgi:hypothetical protein